MGVHVMTRSVPVAFTLQRTRATVEVVREQGQCWGVVTIAGRPAFRVTTRANHHNAPDGLAAEAFIRRARRRVWGL